MEARLEDTLMDGLVRRGHTVQVLFGGGQIARFCGGVLSGTSDPRKDGAPVGY